MGLGSKMKEMANKANETLDQTKKEVGDTSKKIQKVLDESGDSVNILVKAMLGAIFVSILGNLVNIGLSVMNKKRNTTPSIVVDKLYILPKSLNVTKK